MKPIVCIVALALTSGCAAARAVATSTPTTSSSPVLDDHALVEAAARGDGDMEVMFAAFERLSARCGDVDLKSCVSLGRMYEHGLAVPESPARALALYMSACSGGCPAGCTQLAAAYLAGLAGSGDDGRAVALLSGSCFDGHMPACGELGVLYASGRGVPKDLPHARAQFARACGAGHAPSCAELKTPAGRWTQAGR